MTDTTKRAELLAIADQIDLFIKHGTNAIFEQNDAKKIASALRRLASQDQNPVAWLQSRNGVEIVSKHRLDLDASKFGWTERPLYLSPPPAAGWNEAIEAAMAIAKDMRDKYSGPTGDQYTQGLWDQSQRIIGKVKALRHTAPPDSAAGKSAPLPDSSLPSGESDLSVMSDYGGADAINDPIERIVADGLMYAGVSFSHESSSPGQRLDFSLADGVMIECKQFHTSRISDQLAPFSDVILVQGRKAASWLKGILSGGAVPPHGGSDAGVRVKPLEWHQHPAGWEQALAAGLGLYRVHKDGKNWYLVPDHMGEGGKEAAQRDYERRIRSALSHQPALVAANASAEARLREALRDLVWLVSTDRTYDDSESLRSARNILFAENKAAMAALSAHPHTSDCARDGETTKSEGQPDRDCSDTSRSNCEPERCPSDRTAGVTVEELDKFLRRNGYLYLGDDEDECLARTILDAYGMWRR